MVGSRGWSTERRAKGQGRVSWGALQKKVPQAEGIDSRGVRDCLDGDRGDVREASSPHAFWLPRPLRAPGKSPGHNRLAYKRYFNSRTLAEHRKRSPRIQSSSERAEREELSSRIASCRPRMRRPICFPNCEGTPRRLLQLTTARAYRWSSFLFDCFLHRVPAAHTVRLWYASSKFVLGPSAVPRRTLVSCRG